MSLMQLLGKSSHLAGCIWAPTPTGSFGPSAYFLKDFWRQRVNKNNYVPLKNLCDIPTSLEVFFLCSNFFLLPNFVEILKISDPSRYNFTYKKSKRRQISLRCQAPILGIALMLFNCTLSSLLRDVLSVNGEGPWNGCAVQPFQSYSCSEHVSYCSLFLDSSLNPIFSCFSYLYGYPGYLFSIHQQGTFREDGNVSSMVVWRCCHVLLCRFQEEPGWTQIHKWMLEK